MKREIKLDIEHQNIQNLLGKIANENLAIVQNVSSFDENNRVVFSEASRVLEEVLQQVQKNFSESELQTFQRAELIKNAIESDLSLYRFPNFQLAEIIPDEDECLGALPKLVRDYYGIKEMDLNLEIAGEINQTDKSQADELNKRIDSAIFEAAAFAILARSFKDPEEFLSGNSAVLKKVKEDISDETKTKFDAFVARLLRHVLIEVLRQNHAEGQMAILHIYQFFRDGKCENISPQKEEEKILAAASSFSEAVNAYSAENSSSDLKIASRAS